MASLVAHAATGAAIFLARPSRPPIKASIGAAVCVLLALLPDADYLAWWLLRLQIEPRLTHSLLFCCASALGFWLIWQRLAKSTCPTLTVLMLAACSHLVLDFMVGVHPLPLLWPLTSGAWASPIGLLPSAGRLALGNFYLWRNLLIEIGVVFPVLALIVALGRRWQRPLPWILIGLLLPMWLACLAWSISLQR